MTNFEEKMKELVTKGVEKAMDKALEAVRQSLAEWAIEKQTTAAKHQEASFNTKRDEHITLQAGMTSPWLNVSQGMNPKFSPCINPNFEGYDAFGKGIDLGGSEERGKGVRDGYTVDGSGGGPGQVVLPKLDMRVNDVVTTVCPHSVEITYIISHVVNEFHVPLLSFRATDPTLSALQFPYSLYTTQSEFLNKLRDDLAEHKVVTRLKEKIEEQELSLELFLLMQQRKHEVTVRCVKCFHMKCMGTKQMFYDWKSFGCFFAGNDASGSSSDVDVERARVGGAGGGERLLDINVPLPPEEDEVQFVRAQSYDGVSLGIYRQPKQYVKRMQAAGGTLVICHLYNTPALYLQSLHMRSEIHFQKPSQCATKDVMSIYEAPPHHILNHKRMAGNADTRFKPHEILQTSHHERLKLPPATNGVSEVYLQALKDFSLERRVLVGGGWHVEFNCGHALEAGSRGDGVTEVEKGNKRKEATVYLRADTSRDVKNVRREILGGNSFPSAEIINADVRRIMKNIRSPELDKLNINDPEYQKFCDDFPVPFEDLYIIHSGKMNRRNSYHDSGHIWLVGYKSCWHDHIPGSVFVCDILEGGDDGPLFKVQRNLCIEHCIPSSSTFVRKRSENDKAICEVNDDEYTSMQMILTGCNLPCLDDNISLGSPAFKDSMMLFGILHWFWKISAEFLVLSGLDREKDVLHTLSFLAGVMILSQIIKLPFLLCSTIVIEACHGFNNQTIWLFSRDMIKGIAQSVGIGPHTVAVIIVQKKEEGDRGLKIEDHASLLKFLLMKLVLNLHHVASLVLNLVSRAFEVTQMQERNHTLQFPSFNLEDKVGLLGRSNVMDQGQPNNPVTITRYRYKGKEVITHKDNT